MGMVVSFAFIPIILLAFALPVFIGVYVYRDANKRGMNGVLWMLVAILAPTFLGLIIYLLVRGNHSDMSCPACGTRVTETYMVCPNCGAKLRPTCPSCATPVQPEWKVCPHCAEPLPTTYHGVSAPEKPKDKTLFKILIAVLLVPVLLVVLIFSLLMVRKISAHSYREYGISSSTAQGFENEFISEDAKSWYAQCQANTSANVCQILRYVTVVDEYVHTEYLIYQPDGDYGYPHIFLDIDENIFRPDVFNIQILDDLGGDVPVLHHITYNSEGHLPDKINITVNGVDVEEIITTTVNPIYDEDAKEQFEKELEKYRVTE